MNYKKLKYYLNLEHAFSLIELMVVISIISIIISIAIPYYQNYIDRTRVIQMISAGTPCLENIVQSYIHDVAIPTSIVCQGVTINRIGPPSTKISAGNPNSPIEVEYYNNATILPNTVDNTTLATLLLGHPDLVNGTPCGVALNILENNTTLEITRRCTMQGGCTSKPHIYPSHCR